jgi:hypothetical protein
MKDLQVHLAGAHLPAYTLFVLYGNNVSLQLECTWDTHDGDVCLKPSAPQDRFESNTMLR